MSKVWHGPDVFSAQLLSLSRLLVEHSVWYSRGRDSILVTLWK
jgi:hypothetical protein